MRSRAISQYPFRTGALFGRNQWYIAAWSVEIGGDILSRTLLGEDVIFFRRDDRTVTALSGHCPHRWMPLGDAAREGDSIICPYHGARFGFDGACVLAPLQAHIPPRFGLKAYPAVERDFCVWIWMGDPARADPGLIPDAASVGLTQGWRIDLAPPRPLKARAQLLIENLFDQSHVDLVHPATLGGAVSHGDPADLEMVEAEDRFSVLRTLPPTPSDDGVRAVFPGIGDQLMARLRVEILGAALINSVGSRTFSLDSVDAPPRLMGEMNFLHGVTPETPTTTHYFTAITRNFAMDSAEFSEALLERNARVVAEDIAILEAIEHCIDAVGDARAEVSFASDAGAMQVRRRMERLIAQD